MSKLRESARGQACTLRISQQCTDDWGEDVVFCHAPSSEKGIGRKSPDWWGAYGCRACHALMDSNGLTEGLSSYEVNEAWLQGVFETQMIMIEQGLIKVPKDATKSYNVF